MALPFYDSRYHHFSSFKSWMSSLLAVNYLDYVVFLWAVAFGWVAQLFNTISVPNFFHHTDLGMGRTRAVVSFGEDNLTPYGDCLTRSDQDSRSQHGRKRSERELLIHYHRPAIP
jgi:hypothetical protein